MSKAEQPDVRLAMNYEKHPSRYYQRRRGRRCSGTAEWHSRSKKFRHLQKAITDSIGVVQEGQWGDLAMRIALVLNEEER